MNEQLETYFFNIIEEVNIEITRLIQDKIYSIPPHLINEENVIYFYTSLTKKIFNTTQIFLKLAGNLSDEKARKFLTDACHGEFDMD